MDCRAGSLFKKEKLPNTVLKRRYFTPHLMYGLSKGPEEVAGQLPAKFTWRWDGKHDELTTWWQSLCSVICKTHRMTHQQSWWTSASQPRDTSERPTSRRAAHMQGFHTRPGHLVTKTKPQLKSWQIFQQLPKNLFNIFLGFVLLYHNFSRMFVVYNKHFLHLYKLYADVRQTTGIYVLSYCVPCCWFHSRCCRQSGWTMYFLTL